MSAGSSALDALALAAAAIVAGAAEDAGVDVVEEHALTRVSEATAARASRVAGRMGGLCHSSRSWEAERLLYPVVVRRKGQRVATSHAHAPATTPAVTPPRMSSGQCAPM